MKHKQPCERVYVTRGGTKFVVREGVVLMTLECGSQFETPLSDVLEFVYERETAITQAVTRFRKELEEHM